MVLITVLIKFLQFRWRKGMNKKYLPYGCHSKSCLEQDLDGVSRGARLGEKQDTYSCQGSSHRYLTSGKGKNHGYRVEKVDTALNGSTQRNITSEGADGLHPSICGTLRKQHG